MSSREFAEWMAYAQIEPIGEERADLRNAMLMSLIANANRDPKKKSTPFTVDDFLPRFWDDARDEPISREEALAAIDAAFTALAAATGGAPRKE